MSNSTSNLWVVHPSHLQYQQHALKAIKSSIPNNKKAWAQLYSVANLFADRRNARNKKKTGISQIPYEKKHRQLQYFSPHSNACHMQRWSKLFRSSRISLEHISTNKLS